MQFSITDHRLSPAEQVISPNCDARPEGISLDLIVLHSISLPPKQYGNDYVNAFFCNRLDFEAYPYFAQLKDVRVSAHLLIQRDGAVVQFVPFHQRAWHAGASCYRGRTACNDFSIGIELEGADDEAYADSQYTVLAQVVGLLQRHYQISPAAIVGHCDIAPERKTDPGPAFDWSRLRALIRDCGGSD